MLVGTVEEVGPESPLGLAVGDRVATLVSLTLTPLVIEDGLAALGRRQRAGAVRRLRRAVRPLDRRRHPRRPRPGPLAQRDGRLRRPGAHRPRRGGVRRPRARPGRRRHRRRRASPAPSAWPRPARPAPPARSASCPTRPRHDLLTGAGLADAVASPTPATRSPCATPSPPPADRPTSPSSASTSPAARAARSSPPPRAAPSSSSPWPPRFSAAALGAEGLAADVRMLVGNGYVPGHAAYAMELLRGDAGVRGLFERRL